MKTNQKIKVSFGDGKSVLVEHKTLMGSLRDLTDIGNTFRITELKANGTSKGMFNLAQFLNKESTKAYIEHLKLDEGIETPLEVRKKGKNKGTYGHLYLMIYLAQHMSDRFATRVIKTFINDQILTLRDQGGNDFKKLNVAIDRLADRTRDLKPNGNKGCYMNIAKLLRAKIFSSTDIETYGNNSNIWNSPIATAEKQLLRTDYESKLVMLIDMGYITTYPMLKEGIEKL